MFKNSKIVLKLHHNQKEDKKNTQSWIDKFRDLYTQNRYEAKFWFWDYFNWEQQSLWIGRFNKTNNLPSDNEQINNFMKKLIDDLNQYSDIKSKVYIKFYFSRNVRTNEPDINYLLMCDTPQLPDIFANTLVNIVFERYQLTKTTIDKDKNFKNLIDHYINWNNFYSYYDLMRESYY